MDRVAIFGDIHGNLPALELHPTKSSTRFALVRFLPLSAITIKAWALAAMIAVVPTKPKRPKPWANAHTTDENKAFLREKLVKQIRLKLGDLNILLVHGSPRKVNEYLYEDRPDASLERIMDSIDTDVLVCGRQIVNAGSIDKPKDDNPKSCYITLSAEGKQFKVDFLRVAYDVEKAASAIEGTDMPDEFAQMLRDGKG